MRGSFFSKEEEGDCGENAVESVLSMYGRYSKQDLNTGKGTSPRKITDALKLKALETMIRQRINFDKLKPRSIAYYPKDDHYVAIKKVQKNRVLVNDSSKSTAQWLAKKAFMKKWKGWIVETRRER